MRELVPDFENLNSRGARVEGGVYYLLSGTILLSNKHFGPILDRSMACHL